MKLYVVRHGQTDVNVKSGFYDESLNIDINEVGIKEAKEAAKICLDLNIGLIISSPMKRTVHTASIINELLKVEVICDERLEERKKGILSGKGHDFVDRESYWNYYVKQDYEGAETVKELCDRVQPFLDEIIEKYKDMKKNILISTHSGTARAIMCYFNGIPKDGNLNSLKQKTGEITEYIIEERNFV